MSRDHSSNSKRRTSTLQPCLMTPQIRSALVACCAFFTVFMAAAPAAPPNPFPLQIDNVGAAGTDNCPLALSPSGWIETEYFYYRITADRTYFLEPFLHLQIQPINGRFHSVGQVRIRREGTPILLYSDSDLSHSLGTRFTYTQDHDRVDLWVHHNAPADTPLNLRITNTADRSANLDWTVTATCTDPEPGNVVVTPAAGLSEETIQDEPFDPVSQTYGFHNRHSRAVTLTNQVTYTGSSADGWVSLSRTHLTLQPDQTGNLVVTISARAASLPTGVHRARVTFTNSADPEEQMVRDITLSVIDNNDPGGGTIVVLGPNGGENLRAGESFPVRWSADPFAGTVQIQCSSGGTALATFTGIANTGEFLWPISSTLSGSQLTLTISSEQDSSIRDQSDDTFTISQGIDHSLQVNVNGPGRVVGDPGSIDCGEVCDDQFPHDQMVTLTATPEPGAFFTGWSGGDCWGTAPCTLKMDQSFRVTANFAETEPLHLLSSVPSNGVTGVDPGDHIWVKFSEPIVLGPTFEQITLVDSNGNTMSRQVVARDNLMIEPSGLEEGTTYTVTLPAGCVASKAGGETLADEYSFSYTTVTQGEPVFFVSAYPRYLREDDRTTVWIWFDRVQDRDRHVSLTSDSRDFNDLAVTIPAGSFGTHVQIEANDDRRHAPHRQATLTATTDSGSSAAVTLNVLDDDRFYNSTLILSGNGHPNNDDNGNGIFEAGEDIDLLLEVFNNTENPIPNVVITVENVGTAPFDLRVLDNGQCDQGTIRPRGYGDCSVSLRASNDLPTGTYFLQVSADSYQNGVPTTHFIQLIRINVVNNSVSNFRVSARDYIFENARPGALYEWDFHTNNQGDGFSEQLPVLQIWEQNNQEEPVLRHQTWAEVPGFNATQHSLTYGFIAPQAPGRYTYWATINPEGPDHIEETSSADNVSEHLVLIVNEPNLAPRITPVGSQVISADQPFSLQMAASDPNPNDLLTFSLLTAPSGITLSPSGLLRWTPHLDQAPATYEVTVRVADNGRPALTTDMRFHIETQRLCDVGAFWRGGQQQVLPGQAFTQTLVVRNSGPHTVENLAVAIPVPTGIVDAQWTAEVTDATLPAVSGNGPVNHQFDLSTGASVTYTLSAMLATEAEARIEYRALLTLPTGYNDLIPANNQAATTIEPIPSDFGDAPTTADTPYPTSLSQNGARHRIVTGVYLGNDVDDDLDGQPSAMAGGDDDDGFDDEDGVLFTSEIRACQTADLTVSASTTGFLDAWLDFNGDGDWQDANEHLFSAQRLNPGANDLVFTVPCDATYSENRYMRFRFSTTGSSQPQGPAANGEVEDYRVTVYEPLPVCPELTLQPENHQVCPGAVVTFQVSADGSAPFTYQWFHDGRPIAGATADRHHLNGTTSTDLGVYECAVTNACGTVFSDQAILAPNGAFTTPLQVAVIALGVEPACFNALPACAEGTVSLIWEDWETGTVLTEDLNPFCPNPQPTQTQHYLLTATDSSGQTDQRLGTILVSPSAIFRDYNGDGENTVEDIHALAPAWRQRQRQDADQDGRICILDFVYINTSGSFPASPLPTRR